MMMILVHTESDFIMERKSRSKYYYGLGLELKEGQYLLLFRLLLYSLSEWKRKMIKELDDDLKSIT